MLNKFIFFEYFIISNQILLHFSFYLNLHNIKLYFLLLIY